MTSLPCWLPYLVVATSLGFGSTQIASGLNYLFGVESSLSSQIIIIIIITVIATISVVTGLKKGILFLSKMNMILATIFLVVIFFLTDTFQALRIFIESTGMYLQRFVELGTWSSSYVEPEWQNDWTIFLLCLVGSLGLHLLACLSLEFQEGVLLESLFLVPLFVPTFLTFFWFSTIGGSALMIELETPGIISNQVLNDNSTSMFVFLKQFPWSSVTSFFCHTYGSNIFLLHHQIVVHLL